MEWVILWAPSEDFPGWANLTIGHEFGHYVLRRTREDCAPMLLECNAQTGGKGHRARGRSVRLVSAHAD